MKNNLLTALHRWASRQDENFITDAFAHLLRHLLAADAAVGRKLLQFLTDEKFSVGSNNGSIQVKTQVTLAQGRPDIEISSEGQLVYVEAKVESGLGDRQLERYLAELDGKQSSGSTTLVVLSRYPIEVPVAIRDRIIARRWYQVAHWLVERKAELTNGVNVFLVQQLIEFFETRNIIMEKVGPEMLPGLKAFDSLMAMVTEAIVAQKMTFKDSFGREWSGCYIDKTKQEFFFGVYRERPHILVFETFNFLVVGNADELLGFGKSERVSHTRNKQKWSNELRLDSEESPFFALSRMEQMDRIEGFLRESLIAVQKIRQEGT